MGKAAPMAIRATGFFLECSTELSLVFDTLKGLSGLLAVAGVTGGRTGRCGGRWLISNVLKKQFVHYFLFMFKIIYSYLSLLYQKRK